jgi:hypothetical protein
MKKLLAIGSCIFALQSVSKMDPGLDGPDQQKGKRVLIKAIAVMVNSEANRKSPPKRIYVPNLERPYL